MTNAELNSARITVGQKMRQATHQAETDTGKAMLLVREMLERCPDLDPVSLWWAAVLDVIRREEGRK